jgi:uncharacterized protein YbaP (TraB family)
MARLIRTGTLLAGILIAFGGQARTAADKLPIWELQGSNNRVLLLGSVHFLREADYPLPAGIMDAYESADALVMELDMDDLNPAVAQMLMTRLGMSEDGRLLEDMVSEETFTATMQRAKELGLPSEMLLRYEPWYAALMLTQLQMMAAGFDPARGLESTLLARAMRDGKPITGLETMEDQLNMLDRLDAKTQRIFLAQSLEETDKIVENLDAMVTAWRTGNEDKMAAIYLEDMRVAPALFDALLVKRNRNWIETIMALRNQNQDYLVVVGALHLVGEESVVAMLKEEGVEVFQLTSDDVK